MIEFYETTYGLKEKQATDLEAILFGQEDCAPSHGYGPTLRPYHLFHFVTRGEGFLNIDGVRYEIGPGDAFLIPADQVAYYEASAHDPWSYSWAGLTGLHAAQYPADSGVITGAVCPSRIGYEKIRRFDSERSVFERDKPEKLFCFENRTV